jgi:8-oxo-dGTP diphosphatase
MSSSQTPQQTQPGHTQPGANLDSTKAAAAEADRRPIPAAGIVCFKGGQVLLIRRGKPPRAGEWSLPGGRVEWGEAVRETARRELFEETGIEAEILDLLDVVDAIAPISGQETEDGAAPAYHLVLVDFVARWTGGEPRAGDDASDARFVPLGEIGALGLWDETLRVIRLGAARLGLPG